MRFPKILLAITICSCFFIANREANLQLTSAEFAILSPPYREGLGEGSFSPSEGVGGGFFLNNGSKSTSFAIFGPK